MICFPEKAIIAPYTKTRWEILIILVWWVLMRTIALSRLDLSIKMRTFLHHRYLHRGITLLWIISTHVRFSLQLVAVYQWCNQHSHFPCILQFSPIPVDPPPSPSNDKEALNSGNDDNLNSNSNTEYSESRWEESRSRTDAYYYYSKWRREVNDELPITNCLTNLIFHYCLQHFDNQCFTLSLSPLAIFDDTGVEAQTK